MKNGDTVIQQQTPVTVLYFKKPRDGDTTTTAQQHRCISTSTDKRRYSDTGHTVYLGPSKRERKRGTYK